MSARAAGSPWTDPSGYLPARMRRKFLARAPGKTAFTLALAATLPACDFTRPSDPFEAHPDVVTVGLLLVAGESEARLLAVHPHRPRDGEAPKITAALKGSGWTAAFSEELELDTCTSSDSWPGPVRCLGATLPEPIGAGDYAIEGTAPLGSFKGAMTMPAAPDFLEPGDSLVLPPPAKYTGVEIPVKYRTGSDVGTLLADVTDTFETLDDGTEVEVNRHHLGPFPRTIEGTEADTVYVFYQANPLRFRLSLLGIGWHYTNFLAHIGTFPTPKPWPSFGIEGEGVYGYFDGLTPSRAVRVRIR